MKEYMQVLFTSGGIQLAILGLNTFIPCPFTMMNTTRTTVTVIVIVTVTTTTVMMMTKERKPYFPGQSTQVRPQWLVATWEF